MTDFLVLIVFLPLLYVIESAKVGLIAGLLTLFDHEDYGGFKNRLVATRQSFWRWFNWPREIYRLFKKGKEWIMSRRSKRSDSKDGKSWDRGVMAASQTFNLLGESSTLSGPTDAIRP